MRTGWRKPENEIHGLLPPEGIAMVSHGRRLHHCRFARSILPHIAGCGPIIRAGGCHQLTELDRHMSACGNPVANADEP
jgi:hypothetical protein